MKMQGERHELPRPWGAVWGKLRHPCENVASEPRRAVEESDSWSVKTGQRPQEIPLRDCSHSEKPQSPQELCSGTPPATVQEHTSELMVVTCQRPSSPAQLVTWPEGALLGWRGQLTRYLRLTIR